MHKSKFRRNLYIKDEWESIKVEAKEVGRSVSNYLVQLHVANMGRGKRVVVPENKPDPVQKAKKDLATVLANAGSEKRDNDFFKPQLKNKDKPKKGK